MYRRLLLIAVFLLASVVAPAQNTSAGVTGRVRCGDKFLESVSIQFSSNDQGSSYGTTTNRYGVYSISGLRPGIYDAVFSYVGYETCIRSGIRLSLGEEYVLDVEMIVDDNMLQDIDISAEYSHFNETKTGQTYSIKNERLELLPSIERSLLDYTRLSIYSGTDNSMAGRDGRMTTLNIDGASLSNSFGLSSDLPGGGSPVSVDAVDEVQVVIAPYDVRQSNFTGGGINAVTKSGSNTFKASAYTFQSSERLRGNKVYGIELGERLTEAKSIYGVSLGGPLLRDRLFFFVNGEFERKPEPISQWRLSEDGVGDGAAMISRVTRNDMDRFSAALSKYGYQAGGTDLSDGGLTNCKLLARLDWNISGNHNLMVRYNYTENSQWTTPNNNSTVGVKSPSNRISKNSYAFRNNCYTVRDVAWSVVAELNSRFGRLNNRLLLTTSMVGNSRGSDSDLFPHVDIWKDNDMFMSAGYELFSLNTGNNAYTYSASDHLRWVAGHSTLTAGISYEFQRVATNYMMYGTGYYKYASIEDFESGKAPIAFGYTYGYDGIDDSASKSSLGQGTAFMQSETEIGERLRLTYGLRADVTGYYEPLQTNLSYRALDWTRHYYSEKESVPKDWDSPVIDSGRWPDISVHLSPRVGFNWDITGKGDIVLRGGAGLFAGRVPMVFLTNMPNYSNMLQNTVVVSNDNNGVLSGLAGNFLHTPEDMRAYLKSQGYPMKANANAPVKSATLCGVADDFKLPQVLKASFAADWDIPAGFPASISLEGIFNKDINAVYARNLNLHNYKDFIRFYGADQRLNYRWGDAVIGENSPLLYDNVTGGAMLLCNTKYGYSWSFAATASLEPVRNLKLEVSYIRQDSKAVSDMVGSSLYSTWKNTASINDPNEEVSRSSAYVMPHRVLAALTYSISHGKRFATAVGLFYTGSNTGRYSYMCNNDMNGDGVVNDLIYIPASKDEVIFVDNGQYSAEQQQDAFWDFVCNDKYLSRHKGGYAGANDALMPWLNRFDIRVAETFRIGSGSNEHKIQLSVDLMNAGNLINSKWGVCQTPTACNDGRILNFAGTDTEGRPLYTLYSNNSGLLKNAFEPLQSTVNCWYLQLGLRYILN